MPGIFDGFSFNIFDDAIFDTVLDTPPALQIRLRTSIKVPPNRYSVQVLTVSNS